MNAAHIHLVLNHAPVIGLLAGLLLFGVARLRRSVELRNVALGTFLLVGLVTIPVYLTGEPAEEAVEHQIGVAESAIEQHEDAAALALSAIEVVGLAALVGLILAALRKPVANRAAMVTLVLAVIATGITGWTANLGALIHHQEIRTGPPPMQEADSDEGERGH